MRTINARLGTACLTALVLAAALASGCARSGAGVTPTAAAGGMRMGAPVAGQDDPSTGLIASSRFTDLKAPAISSDPAGIRIPAVTAPADGWLVVRSTIPIGQVLGWAPVKRGENRNVRIPLTAADTTRVRVALHADRGRKGVFEFNPLSITRSFDRGIFVGGKAVSVDLRLRGFGVEVRPHQASLLVVDQHAQDSPLRIGQALVPEPAWLVVTSVRKDGRPGRVLAVQGVVKESLQFDVPLPAKTPGDIVEITLVADRGEKDLFEFEPGDPLGSADQPFTVGGIVVSKQVRIK